MHTPLSCNKKVENFLLAITVIVCIEALKRFFYTMATKKKVSIVLGATSRLLAQTSDEPCCSRSLNHENDSDTKAVSSSGLAEMFPYSVNYPGKDGHDHDDVKAKEGAHSASKCYYSGRISLYDDDVFHEDGSCCHIVMLTHSLIWISVVWELGTWWHRFNVQINYTFFIRPSKVKEAFPFLLDYFSFEASKCFYFPCCQ